MINLGLFFGMLFLFALYGCEIYLTTSDADVTAKSSFSRGSGPCSSFIVNEPVLILVGKGVPMLFSTALCANVWETIANLLALAISSIVQCINQIKKGG